MQQRMSNTGFMSEHYDWRRDVAQWRAECGPSAPQWLLDLVDATEAWIEEVEDLRDQAAGIPPGYRSQLIAALNAMPL